MNQFISIGKISRPHGFKGAFVATTLLGKESAFSYLKRIFVGSSPELAQEYSIESSAWMPKGWKLKLQGIESDTQVKEVQRLDLFALRADLKEPAPNEYYVSDLVGLNAVDTTSKLRIGTFHSLSEIGLEDGKVMQHSWNFEKTDGTPFSIPAVKRYVHSVDLANKTIYLQNLSDFE